MLRFFLLTFLFCVPAFAEEIFVVNEDDSHFFNTRNPEEMTLENLLAFVDQYANTPVTHLFLCTNCKVSDFDSQTREAVWKHLDRKPDWKWPANAKILHDKGLDAYKIWIDRCREKGISPWVTMRMNDTHFVNDVEHWIHSDFWRNHPQYWLKNRGLNYAEPEVYEHHMAYVRELFERYDMDGLELDWMRFCHLLPEGKERENAHVITRFVEETRKLAEDWSVKRGHRIGVSVRVPTVPEVSEALGMNAVEWAKKGLVDWIVVGPTWCSTDFETPITEWKGRLEGTGVKLLTSAECGIAPSFQVKRMNCDRAALYGWADTMRYRGADGLYLFNWMDSPAPKGVVTGYVKMLRNGLGDAFLTTTPKRYPVTFHDTTFGGAHGIQTGKSVKQGAAFVISHGKQTGKVTVLLGIDGGNGKIADATLNDVKPVSSAWEEKPTAEIPCQATVRFDFPDAALCEGNNSLVVAPCPDADGTINWVEMRLEGQPQ